LIIIAEAIISVNRQQNFSDFEVSKLRGLEEADEEESNGVRLDKAVRTLYSVITLLMWIRFVYFFRIFRSTGYYVRMLSEVSKDVKHFLFLFGVTIVAFAHAYYLLLYNDSEGPILEDMKAALAFTYGIPFGEYAEFEYFETDYQSWIAWVYFVLITIVLAIVLLNLLISIVGDTFNRIKENYSLIMYKDMLHLINENRFLEYIPL